MSVATGDDVGKVRRSYDASGRRSRAAASRRRIVDAAADLFAEQGYAATTLEQVAARAGVTTKLVVANGPKRDLLVAAFGQRFQGEEGTGAEEARDLATGLLAGDPDAATVIDRLFAVVLEGQRRGVGMWRAFSAAANDDPDIRRAYDAVAAGRHAAVRVGVDALRDAGLLLPGDPEVQTATLALVMGFEPYILMVEDWGWPTERLKSWFTATVSATLIRAP